MNALKPRRLSKHNHPGSNIEDIKRFIVPSIRKQRGVIIIHCGSNDIGTNDIETINHLQSVINKVKQHKISDFLCIYAK